MSDQERKAFKAKYRPIYDVREILDLDKFTSKTTEHMWLGFQAGAAWQRDQLRKQLDGARELLKSACVRGQLGFDLLSAIDDWLESTK